MARRRLPSRDPVEAGAARDRQENAVRIRSLHGVPLGRWQSIGRFQCEKGIAADPIDLNVLPGEDDSQDNRGNDGDHDGVIGDRMESVVRTQEQRVSARRAEHRCGVRFRRIAKSHRSRSGIKLPRDCRRRVGGIEADEASQIRRGSKSDGLVRPGVRNRRATSPVTRNRPEFSRAKPPPSCSTTAIRPHGAWPTTCSARSTISAIFKNRR